MVAVIFDMDGLLVDSEPAWVEAELAVFLTAGIPVTASMCAETQGMRVDRAVRHWFALYPWEGAKTAGHVNQIEAIAKRVVDDVVVRVRDAGEPLDGAIETVERAAREATGGVALASSSPMRLIDAVLERLGIRQHFDVVRSGEQVRYSKPHPDLFLDTSDALGTPPRDCVVLEDSVRGVIAAKAAEMRCIAVPSEGARGDVRFGIADHIVPTLRDIRSFHPLAIPVDLDQRPLLEALAAKAASGFPMARAVDTAESRRMQPVRGHAID